MTKSTVTSRFEQLREEATAAEEHRRDARRRSSAHRQHEQRRKVRRRVSAGLGVLVLALLALAGWTAYQGKLARDNLQSARAGVDRLTSAVVAGETGQAREALFDIQDATDAAQSHTDGPGWALAGYLPVVGDDVDGVRAVADITDDVARDVLPSLVDAGAALSPRQLQPIEGRIDIRSLEEAEAPLSAANVALQGQIDRVEALRP